MKLFEIPIGKVNLVFARTDKGLVGCGAFDVMALEKFGYAAANPSAEKIGIKEGMAGKDALNLINFIQPPSLFQFLCDIIQLVITISRTKSRIQPI